MSDSEQPSVRERDRTFVGGLAWTAGGKWATQLVTWASVIALARILSPAELGLAGMAGLFHVITTMLAEFGLGSAVVQMRDLKHDAIAQLHTTSVAICSLFFGFAVLMSPLVASFFASPEIRWLVVANSTALIMTGFQSIPMALLRKRLDYRRLAYADASDQVVRSGVSVLAALLGASYWSTLVGGLAGKLAATVLVLAWAPFRFNWPQWLMVREPLAFGARVSISGFLNTLTRQVDPLIVAKRIGEDALGAYRFAIDIANAPADKINMLLMRVSGPLIASVQHDHALVRRYFLKIAEPLSISVFPAVVGFSLVAPDAIIFLVGEKWRQAIAPVQLLTLCAGMRALTSLSAQVLIALKDVKFQVRVSVVQFSVLPVVFYFASPYGLTAVALVWLIATPIVLVVVAARLIHITSLTVTDYARAMVPAVTGSAFMAFMIGVLQRSELLPVSSHLQRLMLEIIAGAFCYGAVLLLFRERLRSYFRFLADLRKRK
ncbi:MAG: lipopolysaccharide biosynthesis protein [Bryobacterales bacterium]|nr:lipopolysaccharide biosynthesis protein [Bryobacterales bacterium]